MWLRVRSLLIVSKRSADKFVVSCVTSKIKMGEAMAYGVDAEDTKTGRRHPQIHSPRKEKVLS